MHTLLAVDLSYQSYRASAAHPMLTSGRHFTGGLYGFFTTIAKIIRETQATQMVVCKDSKPYVRSCEYPEYKQLRKAAANEELLKMHKASMRLIEEALVELGLPIWEVPGFESDDLIGHIVDRYRGDFKLIYAASNDSDLYQLMFADNFKLYTTGDKPIWDRARLMEQHGITPDEYMLATALTGTHNDIAGIPKVGGVTAIKAVKSPALLRKYLDSHGDIIERNRRLIYLPHLLFPWEARIPRATRPFNPRDLYRVLGRYDIDVTASITNAIEQVSL